MSFSLARLPDYFPTSSNHASSGLTGNHQRSKTTSMGGEPVAGGRPRPKPRRAKAPLRADISAPRGAFFAWPRADITRPHPSIGLSAGRARRTGQTLNTIAGFGAGAPPDYNIPRHPALPLSLQRDAGCRLRLPIGRFGLAVLSFVTAWIL